VNTSVTLNTFCDSEEPIWPNDAYYYIMKYSYFLENVLFVEPRV